VVLINIPVEHYDLFTAELPITSREYTVMKNSIVAQDPTADADRRVVQILCDEEEARSLLAIDERVYPAVVPYLRTALPVLVS
jgi:hypothetical protein